MKDIDLDNVTEDELNFLFEGIIESPYKIADCKDCVYFDDFEYGGYY